MRPISRPLVSALSSPFGGAGALPWDEGGGSSPLGTYYAAGWSDTNYFSATAGQGRGVLGTLRLVGWLVSITAGTKILACRSDTGGGARGWAIGTGLAGPTGSISASIAGLGALKSPYFTFSPTDVGRLFVAHWTVTATAGFIRAYMAGAEVGSGTATAGAPVAASASDALRIGRFYSANFSAPNIGIVALSATATVMTAEQIATDAATIMERGSRLTYPDLPGQDMHFVASDLVSSTSWHDRSGDDCTLTRNGTPTLTAVT